MDGHSRRYSPPLDGIRAVAILAVFIFHLSPGWLPGGFTGVDVFFALSGYLLGGIILEGIVAGNFSMREFYLRRVQRLAPELILTVAAVLLLWRFFLPPSAAMDAGRHGLWTLANASNIYIWKILGGYWGDDAQMAPLMHTWSLAVEEQFYLLFPALLLVLARVARGYVSAWLLALSAGSLALCVWATPQYPSASLYLLPTRLWELLLGAALAAGSSALAAHCGTQLRDAAGWAGLATLAAGFLFLGPNGFPGYHALVPVAGALLVIFGVEGKTAIAAVLSTPALVYVGTISYALYLWHWPLMLFGRFEAELHGLSAFSGGVAGAVASVAIAAAAYAAIEQPLRARGPGRSRRLKWIAAGFAACLAASFTVDRFTPRMETVRYFDMPAFYGRWYSAGKVSNKLASATRFRDVFFPALTERTDDDWKTGGLVHSFGGPTPQVVVLGSSHGTMYAKLIDSLCEQLHLSVSFLAVDGAPVFFVVSPSESFPSAADCSRFNQARLRWLETWHPRAVFLIERWDTYVDDAGGFDRWLEPLLQQVAPTTARMLFVAQPPVIAQVGNYFNLREWAAWRRQPKLYPDENQPKRDLAAAVAESAKAEYTNLRVLRPDVAFRASDGSVRWAQGRTVYYADDDHLSQAGAEQVREMFQKALEEAAKSEQQ